MMAKRYQDNYLETVKLIASRLLASGLVPRYGKDRLERILTAENADNVDGSIYLEFEGSGTSCTIHADLSYDWSSTSTSSYKDADDNAWRDYTFKADVNWPSHGSTEPGIAMARIAFYQRCAQLAAELLAEFAGKRIRRMVQTAQEVKDQQAAWDKREAEAKARKVVNEFRKGLRAGSDRVVQTGDLVPGLYEVQVDEPTGIVLPSGERQVKLFTLNVHDLGGSALLMRVQ